MFTTEHILEYTRWSGYFTLFCAVLAVLAWVLKWGFRFRLVGVTGFMIVLTVGLFALSLGLNPRSEIPGAVRYARVFDTGSTNVVISVAPDITETELDATLRQAANRLFSSGRLSRGESDLTIRVRTIVHVKPGLSQPVYLGQAKRSLSSRVDDTIAIEIDRKQLAKLPQPTA